MDSQDPPVSATRRGFLGFLTVALGAVPVLGGLFFAGRAGLAPAHSARPRRIPLCPRKEIDALPADGIKEVVVSFDMRQGARVETVAKVVFVTKDPESKEILALDGECTHLACPVQKRAVKLDGGTTAPLTCPCHEGMFSQTGKKLAGPPQRDLRRLRLDAIPAKPEDMIHLLEV